MVPSDSDNKRVDPRDHRVMAMAREQSPLGHSLADPIVANLSYLGAMGLAGRPLAESDIIVMLFVMLFFTPDTAPFSRFSSQCLLRLLVRWALLVAMLFGVGAIVERALYRTDPLFQPGFIASWALLALAALILTHAAAAWLLPRIGSLSPRRAAVIVGVNAVALRLGGSLASERGVDERLLGYFDDRTSARTGLDDARLHLGGLASVGEYVRAHRVAKIYISLPMTPSPRVLDLLLELQDTTASVCFVPDIFVSDVIHGRVRMVAGVPTLIVRDTPFDGPSAVAKRMLDLVVALLALPLAVPLAAAIALAIRLDSPGPVIFKQRRFGLDGTEIMVWKFRTMRTLEDGVRTCLPVTRDDDRVTRVGRFLRKTSLDELPQLLHVLTGTMSIVGPRPHALAVNEQFRRLIPGYMVRHKIKPGITGWAQINGYRGGDDLPSMRGRTEFDLHYLRTWSVGLDLLIIWKTVLLLIRGDRHAY